MRRIQYNSETKSFSISEGKYDLIIYDNKSNGLDSGKIVGLITDHLDNNKTD